MGRRPAKDRSEASEERGEEVVKSRGTNLAIALSTGVPNERHALNFLRGLVQREGYDYKALVKHVFLEGVRVYEASLLGFDQGPTPTPVPPAVPAGKAPEDAPTGRQRVPSRRDLPTTPVPIKAPVPEPKPEPPPPEAPRPDFTGLMG